MGCGPHRSSGAPHAQYPPSTGTISHMKSPAVYGGWDTSATNPPCSSHRPHNLTISSLRMMGMACLRSVKMSFWGWGHPAVVEEGKLPLQHDEWPLHSPHSSLQDPTPCGLWSRRIIYIARSTMLHNVRVTTPRMVGGGVGRAVLKGPDFFFC